jgi:hypothetical protein
MPCFRPITAYVTRDGSPTFKRSDSWKGEEMPLPCGRCLGCRIDRSRQWAIRCIHEASLHEENCFVTLTYDDKHLPRDRSVQRKKGPLSAFMKRLRKRISPRKVRFYGCGEYGELCRNCSRVQQSCNCGDYLPSPGRPHYHALLFGYDFPDKRLHALKPNPVFISNELSSLWPYGFATVGNVTFQSAAYVARYIMKKITGDIASSYYEWVDQDTGELFTRQPEFTVMSLKPGIAHDWFQKYKDDVFPHDNVSHEGRLHKTPAYYTKLLRRLDPEGHDEIKAHRREEAKKRAHDNTPERLAVKETVLSARISRLKRGVQ